MAVHKSELRVGVGFDVNKADLDSIKKEFNNLTKSLKDQAKTGGMTQELKESIKFAEQLENVLNKAWNGKIGQLNLSKVNTEIKNTYQSVANLKKIAESTGPSASQAFNKFASTILNTNLQIKQSNKLLNDMALTFKNTVRFGISSSIFNTMTSAIQKSFDYSVKLDKSLNDIRIVTNKSADDMERFAKQANQAAKSLGNSTRDYTEASLIYYQQGLGDKESAARTETTLKAANVTGQSTKEVSEQLTAVWNGYKVSAAETELYIDKLSAVAAKTAADLEELSVGMSKVASAANIMGVDIDQLNAQIATIVSVTRQAPESVGTALKTIYARMGDIKAGLDDETTLGNYTQKMANLGVNVLDAQGNLRDMGVVIEEIGQKWNTMSREQQIALSQTMAGTRQYNNLLSLFDNWDMYTDALKTSEEAAGSLQRQQDIYMESTAAHLQQVRTEAERTYDILFDTKTVNSMADAMSNLLSVFNDLLAGLGGGLNDFVYLGGVIANIFSDQIGGAIAKQVQNVKAMKENLNAEELKQQLSQQYLAQGEAVTPDSKRVQTEADVASRLLKIKKALTEEEYNQLTAMQKQMGIDAEKIKTAKQWNKQLTDEEKTQFATLGIMKRKQQELKNQNKLYDKLVVDIHEMNAKIEDHTLLDPKDLEQYADGLKQLEKDTKGAFKFDDLANAIDTGQFEKAKEIMSSIGPMAEQQGAQVEETYNRINNALEQRLFLESKEYEDLQEQQQARYQILKQIEEEKNQQIAIQQVVQGVTALISLLTSLSGIIKTLSDDELSAGEKAKRVLTVLLAMVPLLLTSLKSMLTLMPNLAVALGATGASATMGFGAATKAVLTFETALGPLGWVLLGITAALAGIVAIASVVSEVWNKDSIAAEQAAEAAEELRKSNEEVKQSFEELQQSWDAYNTALDKLEELTEGTQEWKEALQEVNETALKIIKSLHGIDADTLKSLYNKNPNTGAIELNKDQMNEIMESQRIRTIASDLAVAAGERYALQAAQTAKMKDSSRDIVGLNDWQTWSHAMSWAPTGGGIADIAILNEQADIIKEVLMKNLSMFEDHSTLDEFKDKLTKLGIETSQLSDTTLTRLQKNFEDMADAAASADEKLKLIADIEVDKLLGNNYGGAEKEISSNELQAEETRIINDIMAKNKSEMSKASRSGNDYYQELAERLEKATGGEYRAATGNTVRHRDAYRTLIFEDQKGTKTEEKSIQWVAQTIAAYEALENVGANAEKAQKSLNNLENTLKEDFGKEIGEQISSGFKEFVTSGNLESLTEEDYKKLAGMDKEDLMDAMGFDEDEWDEFNKMFGKKGYSGFEQALKDYNTALSKFTKNLLPNVKDAFSTIDDIEGLTLKGKKAIAQTLEDAMVYGGQEALDRMTKVFKDMSKDDLIAFEKATSGITDWGNVSLKDLEKALEDAGFETDLTSDQLKEYIKIMRQASGATADFNSLAEKYKEIMGIISNKKYGDVISAEEYNKLSSAGQDYFTRMLDGTYKLTKDASDFYETVKGDQVEKFKSNLELEKENIEKLKTAKNAGYDMDILSRQAGSNNFFTTIKNEEYDTYGKYKTGKNRNDLTIEEKQKYGLSWEDTAALQQQLELLKVLGDTEKALQWEAEATNGKLNSTDYKHIAEEVQNLRNTYENLDDAIASTSATYREDWLALLTSTDDLDEMKGMVDFSDLEAVQAYTEAYQQLREAQRMDDIDVDEMEAYAKHLQNIADNSKELSDDLINNEEDAEDLAIQIMNMSKGIEKLSKNWKNWSNTLKTSSKASKDYFDALTAVQDAMSDLLDIDKDFISDNFITDAKNMEDIGKAAEGDEKAIDRLRQAALKDIVLNMKLEDDALQGEELWTRVQELQKLLDDMGPLTAGAKIDLSGVDAGESEFIDKLNAMILEAGMSVDQVNAMLAGMGFTANFASEPQAVQVKEPDKVTTHHKVENKKTITNADGSVAVEWDDVTTTTTEPGEVHEGNVDAYSMQTSEPGTTVVPKINSVVKKANGSLNSSPKKSGGSGGGGGSSKPKHEDHLKDVADRYHKVNTQISKITNSLSLVQAQQEKLVGKKLLDNLTEQWELLNIQIDNYNEKLKIAYNEQNELNKSLAAKGVQFNEDGTIANYFEAFQAQEDTVNKLIDQYNSLSAAQQESWDNNKTLDKAKEEFDKFKENLDRYDELVTSFIPDLVKSINEAFDEQIEINITKFNKEIEITLNMNQATRDWNKWKKRVIEGIKEDNLLGKAQVLYKDIFTYLNDKGTGDIQANAKYLESVRNEIAALEAGEANVFGNDRAKAYETLEEALENLKTSMLEYIELEEEMYQTLLDEMDAVQENFDKQIEKYEIIHDLLEHDMRIVELVYGEDSYSELEKFYDKQHQNYLDQIDFLRQQRDFWKEQMDLAEEGSEAWEAASEKYASAAQELEEALSGGLENSIDSFNNGLNKVFKELKLQMTSGLGFDYLSDEWDLINKKADQYLDTINAAAGIQSLERKYLKSIDNASRVQDQRKITSLMEEELNALRTKDKLTQYDLDRAEKKYNLMVAQMALEDAQQKKTQMRLRRDSQGNYTYQYVTDEDAVRDAEEAVSTLYNELYNFDKDRYKENLDQMYALNAEYLEKLQEAYALKMVNEEAGLKRIELLNKEYGELINGLEQENYEIRANLQESSFLALSNLYEKDLSNFKDMTKQERDALLENVGGGLNALLNVYGINSDKFQQMTQEEQDAIIKNLGDAFGKLSGFYNKDIEAFKHLTTVEKDLLANEMVPYWHSAIQKMATEFYGSGSFESKMEKAWNKIAQEEEKYNQSIYELEEVSGRTFEDILRGINDDREAVGNLINDNDALIQKYGEELAKITELYNEFIKLNTERQSEIDKIKEKIKLTQDWLDLEKERRRQEAEAQEPTKNDANGPKVEQNPGNTGGGGNNNGSGGGNGGNGSAGGNGTPEVGDMVTYLGGGYTADSYGGGATGNRGPGKKAKITIVKEGRPRPYHLYSTDSAYGWVRKDQISGYDTGGYTGTWGNTGRLAMLHQKELVLNARDTENMLDAVTVMRQLALSLGESTLARLAGLSANGSYSAESGILEQNVHIDAQFPNVRDAREIEAALNNLVNAASQRAFRTK